MLMFSELLVPDSEGKLKDVVLGFDDLKSLTVSARATGLLLCVQAFHELISCKSAVHQLKSDVWYGRRPAAPFLEWW